MFRECQLVVDNGTLHKGIVREVGRRRPRAGTLFLRDVEKEPPGMSINPPHR